MTDRKFSMTEYFQVLAARHEPLLSFKGRTRKDWQTWRRKARRKLLELLGDFPEPVALNPEIEYAVEEDGLIRERVIFAGDALMDVPCILMRPKDMPADGSNAAIVCSHGHGRFGKDAVTGAARGEGIDAAIAEANYDYGKQMARAGFLTISLDLRVFGERADRPGLIDPIQDPCNVHFIRGVMLGIHTLALNVWDVRRCIDYLETRPEVDARRIGMMGLSQGGTMTTFTSAVEPRIRAADIIGYINPWKAFAYDRNAICGSQIVPNVYKFFDTHDIAGLIAPRPLLIEMGVQDRCFPIGDQLEGYAALERIYKAAGAADRLDADLHPGAHAFAGNKAFDFFKRHL